MMPVIEPAFYLLTWLFVIQHPSGEVTNRVTVLQPFFTDKAACVAKRDEALDRLPKEKVKTTDGGKALHSWFECIPVPPAPLK
ncbi:hypothetical protein [Methylobacterium sp. Leaf118]|uniref:hypothetical protein n=1 Tax=Methylobacterium sp. Leaf118 TaxID=2876562 RepID=UPI001E30B8E6|nr:hypothetical protein [Methylobacterium sp. Leaf118]